MNKMMSRIRKISGMLCITLIPLMSVSQTFEKNFKDGTIHFKLKDNVMLKYQINPDKTVDIKQFDFLGEINGKYQISKLSRPYDMGGDEKIIRIFLLEFTDFENIDKIISDLQKQDVIEYAEKCPRRYPLWVPNDPYYALTTAGYNWNWHLDQIKATLAWDIQRGSNTVKVGIVDNAIWGSHPDLQIPTSHQYNGVNQTTGNSAPPASISQTGTYPGNIAPYEWSHGTHCAGNIAAINNNGVGVCSLAGGDGSAANGVQLYAASADDGSGMYNNYIDNGIDWCVNQGCKIISLSLGGYTSSSTDQALINSAVSNYGVIFVASAGNNGDGSEDMANINAVTYPAGYNNVISVAATNEDRKLADFSEYGSWIDIAAPGAFMIGGETYGLSQLSTTYCHNLVTAYVLGAQNQITGTTNYYDVMQGTSMSCPITASLCALLLSRNSSLTPAQVLSCLQSTSQTLASGSHSIAGGIGIIDAQAALQCAAPTAYTCDTLTNIQNNEVLTLYGFGTGQWGAWTGHNSYGITEYAEYYTGMPNPNITGLEVYVGSAYSGGMGGNHKVTFKVYAGGATTPGTVLGSKDIAISSLTPWDLNYIVFDSPVTITGTDVYVGYQIYYNSPADTFDVAQTESRTNMINSGFMKNGTAWYSYPDASGDNMYAAIYVSPVVCTGCTPPSAPSVGTITQPTCTSSTGSVVLNGLPATGNWTLTRTPGGTMTTGTGTSRTITGLPTGTYTFKVTNASGCISAVSGSVIINAQPSTPPTPTVTQNGSTLHSSSATGNHWYNQSGIISNATGQDYTVTSNGDYYVIVTQNGCNSNPSNTIHIPNAGIEFNENNNTIHVYPNPVSDELIIELNGNTIKTSVKILNSTGQMVFKGEVLDKLVVPTAGLSSGMYFIKLENNNTAYIKKIVKE